MCRRALLSCFPSREEETSAFDQAPGRVRRGRDEMRWRDATLTVEPRFWMKERTIKQKSIPRPWGLHTPGPLFWPGRGRSRVYPHSSCPPWQPRITAHVTPAWRNICVHPGLPGRGHVHHPGGGARLLEQLWLGHCTEGQGPAGSSVSLVCSVVINLRNVWTWSCQKEEGCFCWNVWDFIHFPQDPHFRSFTFYGYFLNNKMLSL